MTKKLNIEDYRGKKYGRLTILDFYTKNYATYAICKCDCGKIHHARIQHLKDGKIKSCGCYNIELCKNHSKKTYTHLKSNTRIYSIWKGIKERCYYIKKDSYKNYGARGIKMCQEWLDDFMNFYNWAMQNGYDNTLTIDRIDVNGNYCPDNCRWVNMQIQAINRRTTNKYGCTGVSYNNKRKKYVAYLKVCHKNYFLGVYEKLEEAIKARKEAEKLYFEPLLK